MVPEIPWEKVARYGEEWREHWIAAWEDMGIYDREPTEHVIDNLFDRPDRYWMRSSWREIAALTSPHRGGGQRSEWVGSVPNRDTLGHVPMGVKVVLGTDGRRIVTVHNVP